MTFRGFKSHRCHTTHAEPTIKPNVELETTRYRDIRPKPAPVEPGEFSCLDGQEDRNQPLVACTGQDPNTSRKQSMASTHSKDSSSTATLASDSANQKGHESRAQNVSSEKLRGEGSAQDAINLALNAPENNFMAAVSLLRSGKDGARPNPNTQTKSSARWENPHANGWIQPERPHSTQQRTPALIRRCAVIKKQIPLLPKPPVGDPLVLDEETKGIIQGILEACNERERELAAPPPPTIEARQRRKVAIVGAGVAGLLLAQGLRRHTQYDVTVFERCKSMDDAPDWTVAVHDMRSTKENMRAILPKDVFEKACKSWATIWLEIFQERDQPAVLCKGRKLREALTEGINIRYGVAVTGAYIGMNEGHTMNELQVEPEQQGRWYHLVIGADGRESTIRKCLCEWEDDIAKPQESGFCLAKLSKLSEHGGEVNGETMWTDRGATMMLAREEPVMQNEDGTWAMHKARQLSRMFRPSIPINHPETADPVEIMASCRAAFGVDGAREPTNVKMAFHELVNQIDGKNKVEIECRPLTVWTGDWRNDIKVSTAIGDAARELLPIGGLGLIHAVYDVRRLLYFLTRFDVEWVAINRFEKEQWPRSLSALKYTLKRANDAMNSGTVGSEFLASQVIA